MDPLSSPSNAVANGIATFEGKLSADTLPKGVDGRYLLGIVRNLTEQKKTKSLKRYSVYG